MCRLKHKQIIDINQKAYQAFFGIEGSEQYLVYYTMNEEDKTGYVVFIDKDNDIDYIDKRDNSSWTQNEIQTFHRFLGKLQQAEASPLLNLDKKQIIAFKQILCRGYLQILEKDFTEIDNILQDAQLYLRQRNIEAARCLFLTCAGSIALVVAIIGIAMYLVGNRNLWLYGILFGILGAFVSIWTRYGKEEMTGLATRRLHYMESISRLFVGAIASVVIMLSIRSGLMLAIGKNNNLFFLYCLFGFAAGFSERLLPSLIERIIKNNK